ncbi:unnamed protein product [Orchesella dallaii]|uniref:Uncharacterized protein n=1 Tax=Orchesella dallaii TaxID=48710 RepID=A0ABP1PXD0_9HEXA
MHCHVDSECGFWDSYMLLCRYNIVLKVQFNLACPSAYDSIKYDNDYGTYGENSDRLLQSVHDFTVHDTPQTPRPVTNTGRSSRM